MLHGIFSRMKTHRSVAYDPIAFVMAGTSANGTTSLSVAYPATSITANMAIFLVVSTKLQGCRPSTPTGFRRLPGGESIAWSGGNGSDQGAIRQTIFYKLAVGGESGSVSVTITNGNSAEGTIYVFSKDADANWHIEVSGGHHNIPNTTSYSVRSWASMQTQSGDVIFCPHAVNTDTYTWSAQALAQTGATIETVTQEITEIGTTQGNDQEQFASMFRITGGTGTGHLTFTATSSGASPTPANPIGIGHFIRLRQQSTPQTFRSSGLRVLDPSEVANSTLGTNGEIWDGHVTNWQGVAEYGVEDVSGTNYFYVNANISKGAAFLSDGVTPNPDYDGTNRRRQEFYPVPWQPQHIPGTEVIIEQAVTPIFSGLPVGGVIIMQDHTGAPPGGLTPPNHPLWYIESAYSGQFSGVAAGTVIIARGIPTRIYEKITGTVFTSGVEMIIRTHVKYGYGGGDSFLKVWIDGVQVLNDTTSATIATNPEDLGDGTVGTGSSTDYGGASKIGVYHHMNASLSNCQTNVNAGHNGWKNRYRMIKYVFRQPTDVDYGDDTLAYEDVAID
jgi:hypothetical protein